MVKQDAKYWKAKFEEAQALLLEKESSEIEFINYDEYQLNDPLRIEIERVRKENHILSNKINENSQKLKLLFDAHRQDCKHEKAVEYLQELYEGNDIVRKCINCYLLDEPPFYILDKSQIVQLYTEDINHIKHNINYSSLNYGSCDMK